MIKEAIDRLLVAGATESAGKQNIKVVDHPTNRGVKMLVGIDGQTIEVQPERPFVVSADTADGIHDAVCAWFDRLRETGTEVSTPVTLFLSVESWRIELGKGMAFGDRVLFKPMRSEGFGKLLAWSGKAQGLDPDEFIEFLQQDVTVPAVFLGAMRKIKWRKNSAADTTIQHANNFTSRAVAMEALAAEGGPIPEEVVIEVDVFDNIGSSKLAFPCRVSLDLANQKIKLVARRSVLLNGMNSVIELQAKDLVERIGKSVSLEKQPVVVRWVAGSI